MARSAKEFYNGNFFVNIKTNLIRAKEILTHVNSYSANLINCFLSASCKLKKKFDSSSKLFSQQKY